MNTLTIDLRKLTHSGIGRYLANLVPHVVPLVHAERVQLLGKAHEIRSLGPLPAHVSVIEDNSEPHSLHEQGFAFDARIRPKKGERRLLWVPHYNVPLLYRGPLVCTVHDLAPLDLPETFGAAKRLLARALLQHIAKHASAILTPSQFSSDRITAMLGTPPNRITVTPLAVDSNWPTRTVAEAAPPKYLEDVPYLLFVGNLKPNKNLSTLLEALRLLGPNRPRLLVAGKTDGFRTADDRARTLAEELGDGVRLLGGVTESELIALYRGAAAFVMPSLYEGFGLPVLEAMRFGTPVCASNTTSLPEVAGDAARLFDPRDASSIAAALQDVLTPEHRQHFEQAGIDREARFTYNAAVTATADVLNHTLEQA